MIEVLPALAHVRVRPEMYVGPLNKQGLAYWLTELFLDLANPIWAPLMAPVYLRVSVSEQEVVVSCNPAFSVSSLDLFERMVTEFSTGGRAGWLPAICALSNNCRVSNVHEDLCLTLVCREAKLVHKFSEPAEGKPAGFELTFSPSEKIFSERLDKQTLLAAIDDAQRQRPELTIKFVE